MGGKPCGARCRECMGEWTCKFTGSQCVPRGEHVCPECQQASGDEDLKEAEAFGMEFWLAPSADVPESVLGHEWEPYAGGAGREGVAAMPGAAYERRVRCRRCGVVADAGDAESDVDMLSHDGVSWCDDRVVMGVMEEAPP